MSILVTGATGTIGSLITQGLAAAGAEVKALVRQAGKRDFPAGVTEVVADLTDVPSMRAALSSVRTLFLLNAVTPDEVTQALITLNLAREVGIERLVYLSVIHADKFTNVPHFTGKHTVERMIESFNIPATILRPAYFMQNDLMVQQTIQNYAVYPMPIGAGRRLDDRCARHCRCRRGRTAATRHGAFCSRTCDAGVGWATSTDGGIRGNDVGFSPGSRDGLRW